jgi:hypothetical protein
MKAEDLELIMQDLDLTDVDREMNEALKDGLKVQGRQFRQVTATTLEHDTYVMTMLRSAGLLAVMQAFNPLVDAFEGVTSHIVTEAFASGKLWLLLASTMVEEQKPWSIESCEQNANFFKNISHPVEKAKVLGIVPWVILNFFLNADRSWRTSLRYLRLSAPPDGMTFGVPSTMETGTPSSANLPDTIPVAMVL